MQEFGKEKMMWKLIAKKARTALKQFGYSSDKEIDQVLEKIDVHLEE